MRDQWGEISPHFCKGVICSYVLKLEGDEHAPFYIYCGYSQDGEQRMLAHTGIRPQEQASFCRAHPPVELLSVRIHETVEEAVLCECMSYNLWAGKLGDHKRVRGGRMNGLEMPFPPRGWPRGEKKLRENKDDEQSPADERHRDAGPLR